MKVKPTQENIEANIGIPINYSTRICYGIKRSHILLMKETLHHLGCIPINWCRIFSMNSIILYLSTYSSLILDCPTTINKILSQREFLINLPESEQTDIFGTLEGFHKVLNHPILVTSS